MPTQTIRRKLPLFAAALMLALGACSKHNDKKDSAAASEPQAEFVTQAKPTQADGTVRMLLPDFAELVAQEGNTVVNIQALTADNGGKVIENNTDAPNDDPFYEFFKRLIPNQPAIPGGEEDAPESSFGSGVIISTDGYILTNTHVVKGLNRIKVALNDKREYVAELVGADEKSDIALLKIKAENLPAAKIGNPDELKSGEWVAAIGAPFGFENSVTAGIVSAKGRSLPNESYTPFIQTDVAINMGNSGGPLFNLKGQVVGINSQIYSRSGGFMGISFAIPIDVAMNVADQLKNTGKVQRGQLGVIIQEVSYDLARSFGLDKPMGALVANVMPDSPAAKAGLQAGDIIRSVNGTPVRSSGDLPIAIGAIAPGKTVNLGIWRAGKEMEAKVVLGALDDGQTASAPAVESGVRSGSIGSFDVPAAGLQIAIGNGKDGQELIIRNVSGAAAASGLKRGDIIRQINGRTVGSEAELNEALKAGKNLPVLVQRGGNSVFIALVLP